MVNINILCIDTTLMQVRTEGRINNACSILQNILTVHKGLSLIIYQFQLHKEKSLTAIVLLKRNKSYHWKFKTVLSIFMCYLQLFLAFK